MCVLIYSLDSLQPKQRPRDGYDNDREKTFTLRLSRSLTHVSRLCTRPWETNSLGMPIDFIRYFKIPQ